LIGDAMPHTLVYWSPEVLKMDKYGTAADIWALGVTMYQIVTGEHPFNVTDEESFRDDVFSANIDWSRLSGYPRIKIVIENLLRVDPYKRWDANMVLVYCQEDFGVDI
jgi:serine/threonine protein kinase